MKDSSSSLLIWSLFLAHLKIVLVKLERALSKLFQTSDCVLNLTSKFLELEYLGFENKLNFLIVSTCVVAITKRKFQI